MNRFISSGELFPEIKFEEFGVCDPWFSNVGVSLEMRLSNRNIK